MPSDITPFSTASEMLAALRAKKISSVELTEMHIERIQRHDGALHAIAVPTFDRARAEAKAADERRARGEDAPLLGLPMTLKESEQVAGLPQSAGIPDLKEYRPSEDGYGARKTLGNGAALLGKTNIPLALSDWQADSPNYPRTNNPWDLGRTPGGSTGGGGAALAAGLTPLEVGSDIGGSIRIPAAYCGVWGHRPSETAIPKSGEFPMADHPNPAAMMGVRGPLARSASDLEMLFDLLAGPDEIEDAAWQLHVPPARHQTLSDFRVAVMPPLQLTPLAGEVGEKVDSLASFLSAAGAKVQTILPPVDIEEYFTDYSSLLWAMMSQAQPREEREAAAEERRRSAGPGDAGMAAGLLLDIPGYTQLLGRREAARRGWREFFREWDVLVGPMSMDVAFQHTEGPLFERTRVVDGEEVSYFVNIIYPMLAIFPGLPSTAFPGGLGRSSGLPVGLQAIGPYLEDRTTLRFAHLLEEQWHGFLAPPDYV
jgi:amidase